MSTDELCRSIEHLVHQHLQACQREVAAVVERTFRTAAVTAMEPKSKAKPAKSRRESGARRAPAQIHELGERFYALLCTNPGCTISVYCTELGVTSKELHRPVAMLKRAKLVRSIGERRAAKYFPLPLSSSKAA
jgi:hypothetical protein